MHWIFWSRTNVAVRLAFALFGFPILIFTFIALFHFSLELLVVRCCAIVRFVYFCVSNRDHYAVAESLSSYFPWLFVVVVCFIFLDFFSALSHLSWFFRLKFFFPFVASMLTSDVQRFFVLPYVAVCMNEMQQWKVAERSSRPFAKKKRATFQWKYWFIFKSLVCLCDTQRRQICWSKHFLRATHRLMHLLPGANYSSHFSQKSMAIIALRLLLMAFWSGFSVYWSN